MMISTFAEIPKTCWLQDESGSYLSDMAVGPAPDLDIMARFAIANTNIGINYSGLFMRYGAERRHAAFSDVEKRSEAFVMPFIRLQRYYCRAKQHDLRLWSL